MGWRNLVRKLTEPLEEPNQLKWMGQGFCGKCGLALEEAVFRGTEVPSYNTITGERSHSKYRFQACPLYIRKPGSSSAVYRTYLEYEDPYDYAEDPKPPYELTYRYAVDALKGKPNLHDIWLVT